MDYGQVIKFFEENFYEWSRVALLTLARPVSRFKLTPINPVAPGASTKQDLWLNPKLLAFAAISIILGITINALIPGRKAGPNLFTTVTVILAYWIAGGSLLYIICRSLKGSGRYLDTLSVCIQVYGTIYVVGSFLSLLGAVILRSEAISGIARKLFVLREFVKEPILIFFFVCDLLLSIYLPMAMKPVHEFDRSRTAALFVVLVILLMILFWLVEFPIYRSIGLPLKMA
jgi:hypothetical protein